MSCLGKSPILFSPSFSAFLSFSLKSREFSRQSRKVKISLLKPLWPKGELTLQQESKGQRPRSAEQKCGEPHSHARIPDPESEVEAYFLKAIEIARKQQAKSLELRASTSLARLWQQQGKKAEAHMLLSEVYNWFTEGFDTKDLQEAKALLEELT